MFIVNKKGLFTFWHSFYYAKEMGCNFNLKFSTNFHINFKYLM